MARTPVPVRGRLVVDLGAGTGAASRALQAVGAWPIALDAAAGMLLADRDHRPPAVVADALALPLRTGGVDGVVAAFCLNHLTDPVAALVECVRVCRPGSPIVASAYAEDDTHPVKAAAETACVEHGWEPEVWYHEVRSAAMPRLATVERAAAVCREAGLAADVHHVRIGFAELGPADLLAWRFGMAQLAPFMAQRSASERAAIVARAAELLGPSPDPLVRSIIVLAGIVG